MPNNPINEHKERNAQNTSIDILESLSSRGVFENFPTPMFIKDSSLKFIECNRAFYSKFKTEPKFVIGQSFWGFLAKEDCETFHQDGLRLLKEGGFISRKTEITPPSGNLLHVTINKHSIANPAGEIVGIFGVIVDNTEIIEKNRELQSIKEELESVIRSKDLFFNLLTNDIKNPVNGCIGMIDMLNDENNNAVIAEREKILYNLKTSLNYLNRLLNSVSLWARSNGGQLLFEPIKTNVYETTVSALMVIDSAFKDKNITLELDIPPDEFFTVDVNMFKTVLRNLVTNAYQYSYNNSKILISYICDISNITFKISDFGCGMTQEEIDELFTLTKRPRHNKLKGYVNSGVGLLLAREFVEKHGGRIEVESEVGRGTTFSVIIPKNIQMI